MDDARLDELYAADPGDFVARRDALAKELRAAGDRDGAAAVKALRRPSQAAAILNRLARERRAELRAVLDAGSELAAAQAAAVGGSDGGGDALRGAQRALRAAIDGLVADATRGESEATTDKVRGTLHAAASDDDLRAVVAAGRLDREASPSGFGGLVAVGGQTPQRQTPAKRRSKEKVGAKLAQGGQTPERQRAEAARRKKEEAAAKQRAERRRKELRAAKEAEAAAEQELEAATAALAQVEASLKARRKDVAEAEKRAGRARQRRERLERDG